MSETATTKADKKVKKNELRDTIVVIIEALLIALVFRTFLYQPFSIPTASMQSTLEIGDYFVADKWIWGLGSYSFPLPLPFSGRILAISQPQRGDIAVFHNALQNPDQIAARLFPEAAKANPQIFYSNGHSRTIREVYKALVAQQGGIVAADIQPDSTDRW